MLIFVLLSLSLISILVGKLPEKAMRHKYLIIAFATLVQIVIVVVYMFTLGPPHLR
jgi:hypothetical protein